MRLSTHTDYGLRVLMYLAVQEDGAGSAPEIAQQYRISLNHLRKVVQALAHAGYVSTTRGRGGGLRLSRPPEQIRIGEVVRTLEPDMNMVECFNDGEASCVITPVCRLRGALVDARAAFLDELDRHTLADVVTNSRALRLLLSRRQDAAPSSG